MSMTIKVYAVRRDGTTRVIREKRVIPVDEERAAARRHRVPAVCLPGVPARAGGGGPMSVPPPVSPPPTWLAAPALAGPPQLTERQRARPTVRGLRRRADRRHRPAAAARFPLRVCVRCHTARSSR